MTDEPMITMELARRINYCARGSERLMERYGIDVHDFLKNGYPAREALKINNVLVQKIARIAIEEWERQHGKG